MDDLETQLSALRFLPLLTVHSSAEALSVCQALGEGGIKGVEITLRTDVAWAVIETVKKTLPNFVVGVGTVKSRQDIERAAALGIDFAVSPGFVAELSDWALKHKLNYLPGIATPSELMCGLALGRKTFKLFPAEVVGGVALLKALAAPFPEARFCPTGGVGAANYQSYFQLQNVVCVGGSWMVPPELVMARQWDAVAQLARRTVDAISDPQHRLAGE